MAWLPSYAYRREVRAVTTALGTTETNIPVALFPPSLAGKALANMNDVVLTDTDGTSLLDWYWESKVLAAAVGHVKVPSLTAGQASVLLGYLYYGNAGAADQSDEAGTFSNSFVARWGCNGLAGATVLDSTANAYHSTANLCDTGTGLVAGALDCERDNADIVTMPNANLLIPTPTAITISALCRAESLAATDLVSNRVFSSLRAPGTNYLSVGLDGSRVAAYYPSGAGSALLQGATPLTTDVWYHVAYTRNGTANTVWLNGVSDGSVTVAASTTPAASASAVAAGTSATRCFDGLLDEVRIANVVRSAAWLLAEYMAGAGTLLTYGSEETPPSAVVGRRGGYVARLGPRLLHVGGA